MKGAVSLECPEIKYFLNLLNPMVWNNDLSCCSFCGGNFEFWWRGHPTDQGVDHQPQLVTVQGKQLDVGLLWSGEHEGV